jgi:hypothetical protein
MLAAGERRRCLYIAFNKAIAQEARRRFPPSVRCRTSHSLAYQAFVNVIRVGKALPVTATEVSVKFRRPPYDVFDLGDKQVKDGLRFRIYPESRVSLTLVGKKPGAGWIPEQADVLLPQGDSWHDPDSC